MHKEKVLLVHNFYQIGGGEHTVYENEKRMLCENGHAVVCYTRDNSELKSSVFKKLLLPFTTVFSPRTYFEVKRLIKTENIEIVHCHNTFPLISPAVYYAALHCKVPVVQTVHNFRFLCPNGLFYRGGRICEDCLKSGLLTAVKHGCYRNSRVQTAVVVMMLKVHRALGTYGKINYIFLTQFNREKFRALPGFSEDRSFIKPNFEYVDLQPAEPEEIDHNKYVFVGRLDGYKGIGFLLEAWKRTGCKQLYIYGDGELAPAVKAAAKENPNIHFMGFQPVQKVWQELRTCEAMVLCSELYETFGLTVLESFAAGAPVVCSDIGNPGDIVCKAEGGLLYETHNLEDFLDKLEKISQNREKYSKNALKAYEGKYTPEANYAQLKKIYEEVTKDRCGHNV